MKIEARQHTVTASDGRVETASLFAVICFLLVALQLLIVPPTNAASLQVVPGSQWGNGGLNTSVEMSIYVPDNVVANPPVLVAMHSCGGSGPFFFYDSESNVWADKYGFIVIAPSTLDSDGKSGRCWDNGSSESLTRYGRADSEAIIRMVKYTLDRYQANPNRVYALGGSSGAMMVETMLGVYPEVFKAGVGFAGVTCGANGWWDNRNLTPQQWGDIARAINPGYSGPYPRIQLWHGTADPTVSYNNLVNSAKQYSNLLGLSETPTSKTEEHLLAVQNTFIHQVWQNACGNTLIDAYSEVGGNHGSGAWKPVFWGPFLGLDVVGPDDPIKPCHGGCDPTATTPYVQVNGGSWQQTASVTVTSGGQVTFGPQPVRDGAWSWSGCGTSGSSREQTISPTGSCTATATYTNSCGATSSQKFSIAVNGGGAANGGGADTIVHLTKRNASGFAIDGNNGGAAGQKVYLWSSDANNVNQAWVEMDRGQGFYSYKKANTDFCIDGGNGGANGQSVILWACDANNQNQQWQKIDAGSGNYRLQKRNASGYSIDGENGGANGQVLYLWASDANNQNQQWTFTGGSTGSGGWLRVVMAQCKAAISTSSRMRIAARCWQSATCPGTTGRKAIAVERQRHARSRVADRSPEQRLLQADQYEQRQGSGRSRHVDQRWW